MEFFIAISGKQEGPYSLDQLKLLSLDRETMVWFEGLIEWKKAGDVDQLKSIFKSTPLPYLKV